MSQDMEEFHSSQEAHDLLVQGVQFELDESVDHYFLGLNTWQREDREITEDTVVLVGTGSGETAQAAYFDLRDKMVEYVEATEKESDKPMISMRVEDVTITQDGDDWTVTAQANFNWFANMEQAMAQLLAALGAPAFPEPSAN